MIFVCFAILALFLLLPCTLVIVLELCFLYLWFSGVSSMINGVIWSVETLVVFFSLGNGHSRQGVARVIDVWVLWRFVFHASLALLTTEDQISLQGVFVEYVLPIDVCFAPIFELHETVHDLEAGSNPKAVAAVNQLVDSSVKTTKLWELPVA